MLATASRTRAWQAHSCRRPPCACVCGARAHSSRTCAQVRMCMDVDGVAARLLALRDAFPRADVSLMVAKHGALLARPPGELRAAAAEVRTRARRALVHSLCL